MALPGSDMTSPPPPPSFLPLERLQSAQLTHKLSESFLEPVIFRVLYRTGDRWEILKFAQHPQADMCKQMFLYSNKLWWKIFRVLYILYSVHSRLYCVIISIIIIVFVWTSGTGSAMVRLWAGCQHDSCHITSNPISEQYHEIRWVIRAKNRFYIVLHEKIFS